MKKRILMLFLIGATLVSGVLALGNLSEVFRGTAEHLQRYPLTLHHRIYHIFLAVVFAVISAISGGALYDRLRRTR